MRHTWVLLVVLRLLWTIYGQNGYIHPDEFFQTTEITAGDVLKFAVYRPWEFNRTQPIRSIVMPYIITAPPFYALRHLNHSTVFRNTNIIRTWSLLAAPRLMMTCLSIGTDLLVYKMATILGLRAKDCLLTYASSYVNLVFYTRTLSNSIEAFLFVLLLYLVVYSASQCEMSSDKSIQKGSQLSKKSKHKKKSEGKKEKEEDESQVPRGVMIRSFLVTIIVAGVFNRPTFLMFAFIPYIHWLWQGCNEMNSMGQKLLFVLQKLVLSAVEASIITFMFILCDSVYFESLKVADLKLVTKDGLKVLLSKLTITPWNFIKYNVKSDNLAEHGIHPRTQHILVNTPLLFNVLAVLAMYTIGKKLYITAQPRPTSKNASVECSLPESASINQTKENEIKENLVEKTASTKESKKTVDSKSLAILNEREKTYNFLLVCYFVPAVLLSAFPHQEPRFLIPLLAPLALCFGHLIFGKSAKYTMPWLALNAILAIFYGVLHQGGLVPCLSHIQRMVHSPSYYSDLRDQHIWFYHTYMPPRHLMALQPGIFQRKAVLSIRDFKGGDFQELQKFAEYVVKSYGKEPSDLHSQNDLKNIPDKNAVISVISPASLHHQFQKAFMDTTAKYKLQHAFPLHISTEDLPSFNDIFCLGDSRNTTNCSNMSFLTRLLSAFSLNMYVVEYR